MKKYFRVSIAESMYDGESWSVNQYYEQPYLVSITDDSDAKSIVKALKQGGLFIKSLKYTGWTLEGETDYDLYLERYYSDNRSPLILKLSPIHNDLEYELNSHYVYRDLKQYYVKHNNSNISINTIRDCIYGIVSYFMLIYIMLYSY